MRCRRVAYRGDVPDPTPDTPGPAPQTAPTGQPGQPTDLEALRDGVLTGDRRTLARAITRTGSAVRIGISGPPGVGKSTFIEAIGTHVADLGHRLAVLAVDPTSARTGGSILGDKTRMEALARHPRAFIRPSPSGGELGGVARRTREAGLLCEAAGYDVIVIETVGVGQSELAVADLVDLFVLLASPGDDVQGIKRGIMELADVGVVTKADGHLLSAANHAAADLRRALHLMRPKHEGLTTETLLVSSPDGTGIPQVWDHLLAAHHHLTTSGQLPALRARQATAWMWEEVRAGLTQRLSLYGLRLLAPRTPQAHRRAVPLPPWGATGRPVSEPGWPDDRDPVRCAEAGTTELRPPPRL